MDYFLKGVPDALWRKVKSKCALNGLTIKHLIVEFLQGYVDGTLILPQAKHDVMKRNKMGR
jgi:hypothetical protein